MDDIEGATRDLLTDKPHLEQPLREILSIDGEGPWTFDDIEISTGEFGELVSTGIAVERGNGYQLADRQAVRAALGEEPQSTSTSRTDWLTLSPGQIIDEWRLDRGQRRAIGLLVAALGFLALARVAFMYPAVFRGEDIVLAANDPYRYMEQVTTLVNGPLDAWNPGDLGGINQTLKTGDVLMIVTLWWLVAPLGAGAIGVALAWYPVIAGVLTGYLVFRITTALTGSRTVGLMGIVILAITPAHAYRSALGFPDHHAFDFLLIAGTALALVSLVSSVDRTASRDWSWITNGNVIVRIVGLALGAAAVVLAWRGGPLFLVPIGIYGWAQTKLDVRRGEDPLTRTLPVAIGISLGGILALVPHLAFGWVEPYRWIAPLLIGAGLVVVCGMAVVADRLDRRAVDILGAELLFGAVVLVGGLFFVPVIAEPLDQFIAYMQRTGESSIAETFSIISSDLGLLVGPAILIGFTFYVALFVMVWSSWASEIRRKPTWLATLSFAWWFVLLSIVQIRFTGGLSLFVAVFGAIGFFHLAAWIDLVPTSPLSDIRSGMSSTRYVLEEGVKFRYLVALFVLVAGMGMVMTPVKQSQIAFTDQQYDAATFLEGYSDERELAFPENNVFSDWGDYNAYNTIVSGSTDLYSLSWQNYADFVVSDDPGGWYDRLQGNVGFVLVDTSSGDPASGTMAAHLGTGWGSQSADLSAVHHYRGIYVSNSGSIKAYELVPGANVTATGPSDTEVSVEMDVSVMGEEFTYEQRVATNATGHFTATVPYPGTYELPNGTVTVPETAIYNGSTVKP